MGTLSILVRTDANWLGMAASIERFKAQQGTLNIPPLLRRHELVPLIDRWQVETGYNFFLYREAVRRACHAALLETGCKVELVTSEADIIVPVDDDDIIFRSIGGIIPLFDDPATNVVTWDRITVVHGTLRLEGMRPYIDTCNCAIRRSWLDTWSDDDKTLMLAKHQVCNRMVGQRLGVLPKIVGVLGLDMFKGHPSTYAPIPHPSVVDIKVGHSLYYLHTASISYLSHKMRATDSIGDKPLHPMFRDDIYRQVERDYQSGTSQVNQTEA